MAPNNTKSGNKKPARRSLAAELEDCAPPARAVTVEAARPADGEEEGVGYLPSENLAILVFPDASRHAVSMAVLEAAAPGLCRAIRQLANSQGGQWAPYHVASEIHWRAANCVLRFIMDGELAPLGRAVDNLDAASFAADVFKLASDFEIAGLRRIAERVILRLVTPQSSQHVYYAGFRSNGSLAVMEAARRAAQSPMDTSTSIPASFNTRERFTLPPRSMAKNILKSKRYMALVSADLALRWDLGMGPLTRLEKGREEECRLYACDINVYCGPDLSVSFPAHRSVLAAGSYIFRTMVEVSDQAVLQDDTTRGIFMPGIKEHIARRMIRYLYDGDAPAVVRDLDHDDARTLLMQCLAYGLVCCKLEELAAGRVMRTCPVSRLLDLLDFVVKLDFLGNYMHELTYLMLVANAEEMSRQLLQPDIDQEAVTRNLLTLNRLIKRTVKYQPAQRRQARERGEVGAQAITTPIDLQFFDAWAGGVIRQA